MRYTGPDLAYRTLVTLLTKEFGHAYRNTKSQRVTALCSWKTTISINVRNISKKRKTPGPEAVIR